MATRPRTPIRAGRPAVRLGFLPVRRRLGHDLSAPPRLPDAHAPRRPCRHRPDRGRRGGHGILHEDGLRLVVGSVSAPQADRGRRLLDRGDRAAARRPRGELGPGARDPVRRPRRQRHPHVAARRAARRHGRTGAPGTRVRPAARHGQRGRRGGAAAGGLPAQVRLRERAIGLPAGRGSRPRGGPAARLPAARDPAPRRAACAGRSPAARQAARRASGPPSASSSSSRWRARPTPFSCCVRATRECPSGSCRCCGRSSTP